MLYGVWDSPRVLLDAYQMWLEGDRGNAPFCFCGRQMLGDSGCLVTFSLYLVQPVCQKSSLCQRALPSIHSFCCSPLVPSYTWHACCRHWQTRAGAGAGNNEVSQVWKLIWPSSWTPAVMAWPLVNQNDSLQVSQCHVFWDCTAVLMVLTFFGVWTPKPLTQKGKLEH
jgi:hypothetical protein